MTDEGKAEGLGTVAWESSSHRLAAMPAPFDKGAYWCSTSASLVKGRWHGEAVTEGVVQQSLDKLELMKKALMQEYFG